MADPQPFYSFAWAIEILGPATIRRATTDLMEDAAVATLGDFYKKGLKSIDTRIVEALPSSYHGVRRRSGFQVILSNADGDMDTTAEWRGSAFTLWHYDREQDVKRVDMTGLVTDAQFANGNCTMQLDTVDDALLQDLLPAATINPKEGTPFETAGTGGTGLPLPIIFGSDVLIQPPPISVNLTGDGELSTYDYALGFGDNILLSDAWAELDTKRPGLERLHNWVNAPGSPAYLSSELDPNWRGTRFAVTGNQGVRYAPGMPIRFNTDAFPTAPLYSAVRAYHSTTTPHRVEIYDDIIGAGLTNVQIAGDFAVVRDVYTTVTEGILPVPAEEQRITALRLFGSETSVTALVSNPNYPSGSGGTPPPTIIGDVIRNRVWGLSTRVNQILDATSFESAAVALSFAGLGGIVQGALGWDGKQYPAEQVLDWLCMLARGGRLGKNEKGHWTLSVDATVLSPVQQFVFGPGFEQGTRIKKVISYGRAPLDRAVRNLVLHWMPLGRARARVSAINPQAYARFSTKAVSGVGKDRHWYNPFIRDPDAAEKVLQYHAEILKGADEQLVFTTGVEARDRMVGEVITAISTVDGFSGNWKIVETSKSLSDVQLACIRQRDEAYDAPSGIEHSAEPSADPDTRTPPGDGPNLIPNPEPAPPTHRAVVLAPLFPEGQPLVHGYDSRFEIPNGWVLSQSHAGNLTEFSYDESEAIRSRTVSGHYCRMVWGATDTTSSIDVQFDGIYADHFAIRGGLDHFISFYGDADDGWFIRVSEDNDPTYYASSPRLIRDDNDTDGNGWTRFYARWRPKNDTKRATIGICASKPGTYQFAAVMVNATTGSARKPPEWKRHTVSPQVLIRQSQEIELDGSEEYRVPLIHAGDYVLGCTVRATAEIITDTGGGTQFSVGTDADPEVWARRIRDPFARTTSADFKPGAIAAFAAEDADVVVAFEPLKTVEHVQTIGTAQAKASGTTTALTVPAAGVGRGHSILLAFAMDDAAGDVTATDAAGNTYAVDSDVVSASNFRLVILSAHNVDPLTSGQAITVTHPSTVARALSGEEFAGLKGSGTFDLAASDTGASDEPDSGATSSTAQSAELLLAVVAIEGPQTDTFSPTGGFSTLSKIGTTGGGDGSNITVATAFRMVTATGAYSATGTISDSRQWIAAIATYRAASGLATSGRLRLSLSYTRSYPTPGA